MRSFEAYWQKPPQRRLRNIQKPTLKQSLPLFLFKMKNKNIYDICQLVRLNMWLTHVVFRGLVVKTPMKKLEEQNINAKDYSMKSKHSRKPLPHYSQLKRRIKIFINICQLVRLMMEVDQKRSVVQGVSLIIQKSQFSWIRIRKNLLKFGFYFCFF